MKIIALTLISFLVLIGCASYRPTQPVTTVRHIHSDTVNVKRNSSQGSSVIFQLHKGDKVEVEIWGGVKNGYSEIYKDGVHQGYVLTKSLHTKKPKGIENKKRRITYKDHSVNTTSASDPLEYKLAIINAGGYVSKDNITVARFRNLLQQLELTFVENKQQIADMSILAQNLLRKDGIDESLLNIMEAMNQLFSRRIKNQKYAEYASAYVTLRSAGQPHSQATRGLQAILRSIGVN